MRIAVFAFIVVIVRLDGEFRIGKFTVIIKKVAAGVRCSAMIRILEAEKLFEAEELSEVEDVRS